MTVSRSTGIMTILPLVALFALVQSSSTSNMNQPPAATRPVLVEQALQSNTPLYYFGLGSNMLQSKLENRSSKGKIQALSFEPAVVHNHRLAFNMRGFVPLEPAMGSLEPVESTERDDGGRRPSRPLLAYEKPECHGALVLLSPEDYEKVMESEGISKNNLNSSGYEEVVVTAVPYDTSKAPVLAVALRARQHVRLHRDPAPSKRYMQILRDGAAQLGLAESYQNFLASHPVQHTPGWIKQLAVHNLIFTFTLNTALNRGGTAAGGGNPMARRSLVSKIQTWLLFRCYVPPTRSAFKRALSDAAVSAVLLPGALAGVGIRWYRHVSKTEHPPFMKRILGLVHDTPPPTSTSTEPSVATAASEKVAA
jgi:hypothetical protein